MADNAPPDEEEPTSGDPQGTPAAMFARARALLDAGETLEALALLERVHEAEPDNPRYSSWLGLLLAQERGQTKRGLELCGAALERDTDEPAHFMNFARVLLKSGSKREAIDVLRDGMRAHPDDEPLSGALVELGIRKPPPFRSLERSHPVNKYLGLFLARIGLR